MEQYKTIPGAARLWLDPEYVSSLKKAIAISQVATQVIAMAELTAKVQFAKYQALVKAGFTPEQALILCR